MKLTKYEHSCIVLEEQGKKLVIDPGGFTPDFGDTDDIVAVVVTHVHGDHFKPEHLETIVAANPEVQIFTTNEVAAAWHNPSVKTVKAGDTAQVAGFKLLFGGEKHAVIHPDWPYPENTTVMVNDSFYFPGDSYVLPDESVSYLAVPAIAPWMKVAESVDYIMHVKPKHTLPIHDGLLNENGKGLYYWALNKASEEAGATWHPLKTGESLEI